MLREFAPLPSVRLDCTLVLKPLSALKKALKTHACALPVVVTLPHPFAARKIAEDQYSRDRDMVTVLKRHRENALRERRICAALLSKSTDVLLNA